jgi:hypothetical protein
VMEKKKQTISSQGFPPSMLASGVVTDDLAEARSASRETVRGQFVSSASERGHIHHYCTRTVCGPESMTRSVRGALQ